jgi:hypothetical protein
MTKTIQHDILSQKQFQEQKESNIQNSTTINSLKEEKAQNILKNYTNLVNRLKSSQKDSIKESQFQQT